MRLIAEHMLSLLLSDNFPPKTGGSGRWFWEIYRRLPRDQFVVAAGEDAGQLEFDANHDLAIHRLPLVPRAWGLRSGKGLVDYWKAVRALHRIVRAEGVT